MNHRCIDESQLDHLLELSEDHRDRREVDSCARCRTLLKQYAAFRNAHVPEEARYDDAGPALDRFKESLLSDLSHPKQPMRSTPSSFWKSLRGPRARFAWGAVAAAAVVVFIAILTWAPWGEREIVLRSESPTLEPSIELPEMRLDQSGAVEMKWPRVRAADAYRMTVYTLDFEQIFTVTTADTSYVLKQADLAGGVESDDILEWRIEALRGGEVVERSQPGVIRLHRGQ